MKSIIEPMKGKVIITILDKNGAVKSKNIYRNIIVSTGKAHFINQLADQSQASMSHIAVGTGTTTPVVGDTTLANELTRKVLDSKVQGTSPNDNQITYTVTFGSGEAVGALTEAGIFNAASNGVMLNRLVFDVRNKQTDETMIINWTLTAP